MCLQHIKKTYWWKFFLGFPNMHEKAFVDVCKSAQKNTGEFTSMAFEAFPFVSHDLENSVFDFLCSFFVCKKSHVTVQTALSCACIFLPSSSAKQIGIEFSAKGNQNYSLLQAVYFSYSFYTRPNMKGLKGRLIWLAEHLENWKKKQTLPKKLVWMFSLQECFLNSQAKLSRDNDFMEHHKNFSFETLEFYMHRQWVF